MTAFPPRSHRLENWERTEHQAKGKRHLLPEEWALRPGSEWEEVRSILGRVLRNVLGSAACYQGNRRRWPVTGGVGSWAGRLRCSECLAGAGGACGPFKGRSSSSEVLQACPAGAPAPGSGGSRLWFWASQGKGKEGRRCGPQLLRHCSFSASF